MIKWLRALLMCVLSAMTVTTFSATEAELRPGFVNPGYVDTPEWFKVSFLDLAEDVADAATVDKQLILYFHQDGCPYCKRLIEDNFGQRKISDLTRRHFEVISINMWGDREVTDLDGQVMSEKDLAIKMRVMFTPTLLFLNRNGQLALRLNGYVPPQKFVAVLDYIAAGHEGRKGLGAYLAQHEGRKASGRLHRESGYLPLPLNLVRRDGDRPLMVLFEQKICAACDELHGDIFRRPESRALLRQFDIALVDIRSNESLLTPDGRRMTAREWLNELNIFYAPSLLFFNSGGREVFRAEAYLRAFHIQSSLEYVASGAYRNQPSFQRFVQARADRLREQGVQIDLMQ